MTAVARVIAVAVLSIWPIRPIHLAIAQPPSLDAAEPQTAARQRFESGIAHFNRGELAEALDDFEASYRLYPVAAVLNNIGLAQRGLGRDREAIASFRRYLSDAPPDSLSDDRRAAIERVIAELTAKLPPTTTTPARPYPTPAVIVSPPASPGFVHTRRGEAALAIGAISSVALLGGVITGSTALAKRADYDRSCQTGPCDASVYRVGHELAVATNVELGVGLVGAILTTVLVLTRPRPPPVTIHPLIGEHGAAFMIDARF